jgi:hypothetical protein
MNQTIDWPERLIFSTWGGRFSVRSEQYRLDDRGQLFDMQMDPGQTQPVNEREPQKVAQLKAATTAWQQEMLESSSDKKSKPLPGNAVDPRPIPVGYTEFPITMLPARDGEPRGSVKRSSNAPNCSYFVNWTSTEDSMVWLLDVHTTGRYEVVIDYTCPVDDVGSLIELTFKESRLSGHVQPGWDPPLYTNQDTLPRTHGESQMKEFRQLKLGEMPLSQGEGPLTLHALKVAGKTVMDVRRVTLTLLP